MTDTTLTETVLNEAAEITTKPKRHILRVAIPLALAGVAAVGAVVAKVASKSNSFDEVDAVVDQTPEA